MRGLLSVLGEQLVNLFEVYPALLEQEGVGVFAELSLEDGSDLADVLELAEDLLVVAAALGRGPRGYKDGQFVEEVHFPAWCTQYLIFFLEVIDFLCTSMKMA